MTSKLTRKQAEHVRAWLCHLICTSNLPDSFWSEMEDLGLDRDVVADYVDHVRGRANLLDLTAAVADDALVADYVEKRYERVNIEMGQPSFTLWP